MSAAKFDTIFPIELALRLFDTNPANSANIIDVQIRHLCDHIDVEMGEMKEVRAQLGQCPMDIWETANQSDSEQTVTSTYSLFCQTLVPTRH